MYNAFNQQGYEKGFNSELVCDKKYLKTKAKSYVGKINTNFHNDNMPKEVN